MSELVGKAIKTPEMIANQERRGLTPCDLCGDALVKYRQDEMDTWREVIKKAGIERE